MIDWPALAILAHVALGLAFLAVLVLAGWYVCSTPEEGEQEP